MSDVVVTTIVSVIGTVMVAYIVNVLSKRKPAKPKDRLEGMFDGYERLIRQQEKTLEYKDKQLAENQRLLVRLQYQIDELREITERQKEELDKEREINHALHEQIKNLRDQYSKAQE